MTFQAVPWPLMGRGEVRRGLTLLVSFVRMKTLSLEIWNLEDLEVGRPKLGNHSWDTKLLASWVAQTCLSVYPPLWQIVPLIKFCINMPRIQPKI